MLDCCLALCDKLQQHTSGAALPPTLVIKLHAEFQAKTGFLFKVLAGADDPQVAQLLLRLNYNGVSF